MPPAVSETLLLSRIDELPEALLDTLAAQFHADFYDLAGTLAMKRETIRSCIQWHMKKGTVWAIKKALSMIDISAEFERGEEPYTFKLKTIITGDYYRTKGRDKIISSIRRAVDESKALRSYMAGLETRIEFKEQTGVFTATVPLLSGEYTLKLERPSWPEAGRLYYGSVLGLQGQERIFIEQDKAPGIQVTAGYVFIENRDYNLGVDLSIMQELLERFENRIFWRMDESEGRIMKEFSDRVKVLNAGIEELKDMLRWKAGDEEL